MVVSQNFSSLAREFEDISTERDLPGLAALGLTGAGGGVIAEEVKDRIMPLINQPRNPNTASGLFISFAVKMLVAFGLGVVAARVGMTGTVGQLAAVAGAGAAIAAGIDAFDAFQQTGFLAEMPMGNGGAQRRVAQAQPAQSSTNQSTSTTSSQTASAAAPMHAAPDEEKAVY